MDLSLLNKSCLAEKSEAVKLKNLPVGEPQKILSGKMTRTKYGECILLKLINDRVTFLPRRVTDSFRSNVVELDSGNYSIVFKGLKEFSKMENPTPIFEIIRN